MGIKLELDPAIFTEIYGKFSETLAATASENIKKDWSNIAEVQTEWEKILDPVIELVNEDELATVKKHVHLFGMGVEALRLYFLSLLLAEADYVNAARVVLRSALDALAKGILLDRIHQSYTRQKIDPEKDYKSFRSMVNNESRMLKDMMIAGIGGSTPFYFLLNHFEDVSLSGPKTEPNFEIADREPRTLYIDLSKSTHEDATLADSYVLASKAVDIFQLIPKILASKDEQQLFSEFLSNMTRREAVKELNATELVAKQRLEFFKDIKDATKISAYIIRKELRRIGLLKSS